MFRKNLASAKVKLAEAQRNPDDALGKLADAHYTVRNDALAVFDGQIEELKNAIDNFRWMLQLQYGEIVD